MVQQLDVIIIGTGTAALAAADEVKRVTNQFIIVSNGIYGTTCVTSGCMPSKVLTHASDVFHQRFSMEQYGIEGANDLRFNSRTALEYIRCTRKHFLKYILEKTEKYRANIIEGTIWFHGPAEIDVNGLRYRAKRIIIATGSTPIIPSYCHNLNGGTITSDTLFEMEILPPVLNVLGVSVLGAEMAQAFSQLGCKVHCYHANDVIGGLSDPAISKVAVKRLSEDMDITLNITHDEKLLNRMEAYPIFVSLSRKANLDDMGLENFGVCSHDAPVIDYDPSTMQVGDLPLFVAGDVKLGRSILHEASDEGHIAGYNAVRERCVRFTRRTPLQITHTNPTIAVVGSAWNELAVGSFVTGKASFENQGCARLTSSNYGLLHIYVSAEGVLLGAELCAPGGEHLAHLLAWLIQMYATVTQALQLPFYHPTVEEGIRTALKNAAQQLGIKPLTRSGLAMAI